MAAKKALVLGADGLPEQVQSGDTLVGAGPGLPASSTDNALVRWDSTGGNSLQNSSATVSDNGCLTIAGGTITADEPALNISQTWNNAAVAFAGIKFNVTDTASSSSSVLADFTVGNASKLSLRKDGMLNVIGGSTSLPAIKFGNVDTGIYSPTDGYVGFNTNTRTFANFIDGRLAGTGKLRICPSTTNLAMADTPFIDIGITSTGDVYHKTETTNQFFYKKTISKTLTESTNTGIVEVSVTTGQQISGKIQYHIEAGSSGSWMHTLKGSVAFAAINVSGNVIVSTPCVVEETKVSSVGDITCTATVIAGTGKITVGLTSTNIGVPTAYQFFSSLALLIHCNGANNSSTFIDSSISARTITANGAAKISTAHSKFGGAAMVIASATDFLITSGTVDLSTGSYTIEGFFKQDALSSGDSSNILLGGTTYPNRWIFDVLVTTGTASLRVVTYNNTVLFSSGTGSYTLGQWAHFAFVNNAVANTFTCYLNGINIGSRAAVQPIAAAVSVAKNSPAWTAQTYYLDEISITLGIACYSANFTPPNQEYIADNYYYHRCYWTAHDVITGTITPL
jgi:hypothetical protein